MDSDRGIVEEEQPESDDGGRFERTDVDSDEERDGDVDADGASAIPRRNA